MRLYLARHATTDWSGVRFCGRTDPPLNRAGRAQAAELAHAFARARLTTPRIWSSPARRARDTATPIATALGAPVELDERLREVDFGLTEGRTFEELERAWPAIARSLIAGARAIDWPEGEQASTFRERIELVVRDLEKHANSDLVLVTHGGPLRALAALLSAGEDGDDGFEPAHVTVLERERPWRVIDRWPRRSDRSTGDMKTESWLAELVMRIGALDASAMQRAALRQHELTKPAGSLGRLEELAIQFAGITRSERPTAPRDKAVIVMVADHGVAAEGVSAYPQAVTGQMVLNFLHGGAAINVLARAAGARVVVVDMGVASSLPPHPDLWICRLGAGTRNLRREPAMSRQQGAAAVAMGVSILEREADRGLDLVATGDMGIANTTAASAVVAALTGSSPAEVVGRGTGIDDAAYARKVRVVEKALELHRPDPSDALDVLAKVGGFEIGGLAGVILAAAARRIPVVLDGFISGASALFAASLAPACRPFLIASHRSVEIGHRVVLDRLGLRPLLDLDLRLGEGTGAALAMPLIEAALRVHREMSTFAEANVSNREASGSSASIRAPEAR